MTLDKDALHDLLTVIHAQLTEALDDCGNVSGDVLDRLSKIEGDLEQTISDLATEDGA